MPPLLFQLISVHGFLLQRESALSPLNRISPLSWHHGWGTDRSLLNIAHAESLLIATGYTEELYKRRQRARRDWVIMTQGSRDKLC